MFNLKKKKISNDMAYTVNDQNKTFYLEKTLEKLEAVCVFGITGRFSNGKLR